MNKIILNFSMFYRGDYKDIEFQSNINFVPGSSILNIRHLADKNHPVQKDTNMVFIYIVEIEHIVEIDKTITTILNLGTKEKYLEYKNQ